MSSLSVVASPLVKFESLGVGVHIHGHFYAVFEGVGAGELSVPILPLDVVNFSEMLDGCLVIGKALIGLVAWDLVLQATFVHLL